MEPVPNMSVFVWLGSLLFLGPVSGANLIRNPEIEFGITFPWTGYNNARLTLRDDIAHSGKYSLELSYRYGSDQGVSQHIPLTEGVFYTFKAFVKQLKGRHGDLNYHMFQTYNASIIYTWADTGKEELYPVAFRPFVQFGSGWVSLEGEHQAPTRDFTLARILINGPEADIDFLVDDVSIEALRTDSAFIHTLDANIEKVRKSTVHIEVRSPPSYKPEDIDVKYRDKTMLVHNTGWELSFGARPKAQLLASVDHKRHLFGFGCHVNQDWIVDPSYKEYQSLFYKMFNWATLDGFEWTRNQGTKGAPDYSKTERAVDELLKHGIKLRGNAMFWGVPGKSPDWVEKLDGPALKTAIKDRVAYISNLTRGKISHWDVNNELLHGQLYEETTGDPNFSQSIYNMVHEADPSAKLFLNDFDVVPIGAGTQAYIDLANDFLSANTSLYGLGVESQAHTTLSFLWRDNLQNLTTATGLPVWISDLIYQDRDVNYRGSWLVNALKFYFSNPAVEGITLAGFWDHDAPDYSSLVDGLNYKINSAGTLFLKYTQETWSTHETYNLTAGPIYPIEGFHGDYDIAIYYQGKLILTDTFQLGKKDLVYKVVINGTEGAITLPTTPSPVSHNPHISHVSPSQVGSLSSRANNLDLNCTSRWSPLSEFGVEAETHVHCKDEEVLTGCSSIHENNSWRRGGEAIEKRSGKISCSAKTLESSTAGIYAIARCCKSSQLTCDYWKASAQTVGRDEEMETDCPLEYFITGCSASNNNGLLTEAAPSLDHRGCYTHKPREAGVTFLYGACCQVPTLSCLTVKSPMSALVMGNNASVACADGYVMTGCNVNSYSGRTAGAVIEEESNGTATCVAVNGDDKSRGEEGAIAMAVCCKLSRLQAPMVG